MIPPQQNQTTEEILDGSLVPLMLKLSIPGIVAMVLISLNTFIDILFAGQLIGETALAAISLALPITVIVIGFAMGLGVGSASVLSRAIGAGDIKIQSKIFGNLAILSTVISFFLGSLGYFYSEELIYFMGGEGEIAYSGAEYLKTYMLGAVFLSLAVSSSQLIKAEGKIYLATIFSGIYVATNVILNPIFISVFDLEIKGIAWATVISALVYSIINSGYFLTGKSSIPVNPRKFVLATELLPAISSVGASVVLAQVTGVIQQIVIFKSISHYGEEFDIAFAGAALGIYSLAITPVYGCVQALQPVIGINYGAKKFKRVNKGYFIFAIGGTILITLIWLPLQLFPATFLGLLLPGTNFQISYLINFRIIILLLPLVSFVWCSVTLFQSLGEGKTAGIIVILRQLVLFIPTILIVPSLLGIDGIYYSLAGIDILIILIVAFFTWKQLNLLKLREEIC